jgi:hypothetical protein
MTLYLRTSTECSFFCLTVQRHPDTVVGFH